MNKKALFAGLLLALFVSVSASAAEKFVLDAAHSNVEFGVRHLVISKTKGTFNDVSGVLMFDKDNVTNSSVQVTIKTASIDTENEKRDGHLMSADFFDAEKYPEITFVSKKIVEKDGKYTAIGDFTIKDVTKEIELPFEITGVVTGMGGNTLIGVEAELTIDRRDYGLTWSKVMETGALVVGNDVEIEISVEFGSEM